MPFTRSICPTDIKTSPERPVLQLSGHLEQTGSDAGLIYPLEQLRRRRERAVYPRTATHWSELGAFIAYEVLMDEIGKAFDVPRLSEDDIEWVEEEIGGDLGFKLDPVEYSALVFGDIRFAQRAQSRVGQPGRATAAGSSSRATRAHIRASWSPTPSPCGSFPSSPRASAGWCSPISRPWTTRSWRRCGPTS